MNQRENIRRLLESKAASLRPILMKTYHRCFTKYGDFDFSPLVEEAGDLERHFFSQALNEEDREFLVTELAFLMWESTKDLADREEIPLDPILFERWCAQEISSQGWDAVNTPASGDQGVDVIARREAQTVSVQCKRYSKPVGNQAVQEVIAGRTFYSTDFACVISTAGFSTSAKDLARASKVELLDARDISDFSRLFGHAAITEKRHGQPTELEQYIIAKRSSEVLELAFILPGEIALCNLMKLALNVSPVDDSAGYGEGFRELQDQTKAFIPSVAPKFENVSGSTESLQAVEIALSRLELLVVLRLSGFLCLNSSITITPDPSDPNAASLRGSKNPKVQEALHSGSPVELPIYEVFDHTVGEDIQRAYETLLASAMVDSSLVARMPEPVRQLFLDHPFLDVDTS